MTGQNMKGYERAPIVIKFGTNIVIGIVIVIVIGTPIVIRFGATQSGIRWRTQFQKGWNAGDSSECETDAYRMIVMTLTLSKFDNDGEGSLQIIIFCKSWGIWTNEGGRGVWPNSKQKRVKTPEKFGQKSGSTQHIWGGVGLWLVIDHWSSQLVQHHDENEDNDGEDD